MRGSGFDLTFAVDTTSTAVAQRLRQRGVPPSSQQFETTVTPWGAACTPSSEYSRATRSRGQHGAEMEAA